MIGRQPPFSSADHRKILDAAAHVPRDRPIAHLDSRILHAADRLAPIYAERPPRPPTPFDDRISEAETAEAEARATWEKAKEARDERAIEVGVLTGSGSIMLEGKNGPVTIFMGDGLRSVPDTNPRQVLQGMAAAQEAQEHVERVQEAFKKSRVAKNELEFARGRWRAASPQASD